MNKSLLILLAVAAVASAANYPEEFGQKLFAQLFNVESASQDADNFVIEDPENHGWIINSEAKKAIYNLLEQMPCGWPDKGIPPLAPYRNEGKDIHIKKSIIETLTQLIRFRVDGLDGMKINKLKISYTFSKKVKYSFTFPRLSISGKHASDTLVNLLEEYGIRVRYEGNGDFEFALENLNIAGQFKYKMPFLFGSIKIYKFSSVITLGNCVSNIGGLLGNGRTNNMINEKIEDTVLWAINGNQDEISKRIEEFVVPTVNGKLKGHKIWYLFSMIGGGSSTKCVPPPDPWA